VDASGRVSSELRIVQASHMDRGDYVCVAANAYGHDKATIHLLVQEPPDFPRNLHVAEQGSRSILLAWSSPASDRDANHASSPITNYIVQYKEAQGTRTPLLAPFPSLYFSPPPYSSVDRSRVDGEPLSRYDLSTGSTVAARFVKRVTVARSPRALSRNITGNSFFLLFFSFLFGARGCCKRQI